jgi:hypothetical protein
MKGDGSVRGSGMSNSRPVLRHVTTVAVLLMVQGACDLAFGLALTGFAIIGAFGSAPILRAVDPAESQVAVIVFGPALLLVGALKVYAGIRNYRYRGRLLGFVALASCVISLANCVCGLLALPLLIAGIVVYRHADVERAFVMGEQGLSREWIQARTARR